MELEQLIQLFEKANGEFLVKEKGLILDDVSERTLCGSLMTYLRKTIMESAYYKYYVDVEYNRNNGKVKTIKNGREEVISITCDLIVHSRGEIIEQDNLIALEMKKSTANVNDKAKDRERLMILSMDSYDNIWSYDGRSFPEHVCRYKVGIYYEINVRKSKAIIEYYQKGHLFHKYELDF